MIVERSLWYARLGTGALAVVGLAGACSPNTIRHLPGWGGGGSAGVPLQASVEAITNCDTKLRAELPYLTTSLHTAGFSELHMENLDETLAESVLRSIAPNATGFALSATISVGNVPSITIPVLIVAYDETATAGKKWFAKLWPDGDEKTPYLAIDRSGTVTIEFDVHYSDARDVNLSEIAAAIADGPAFASSPLTIHSPLVRPNLQQLTGNARKSLWEVFPIQSRIQHVESFELGDGSDCHTGSRLRLMLPTTQDAGTVEIAIHAAASLSCHKGNPNSRNSADAKPPASILSVKLAGGDDMDVDQALTQDRRLIAELIGSEPRGFGETCIRVLDFLSDRVGLGSCDSLVALYAILDRYTDFGADTDYRQKCIAPGTAEMLNLVGIHFRPLEKETDRERPRALAEQLRVLDSVRGGIEEGDGKAARERLAAVFADEVRLVDKTGRWLTEETARLVSRDGALELMVPRMKMDIVKAGCYLPKTGQRASIAFMLIRSQAASEPLQLRVSFDEKTKVSGLKLDGVSSEVGARARAIDRCRKFFDSDLHGSVGGPSLPAAPRAVSAIGGGVAIF